MKTPPLQFLASLIFCAGAVFAEAGTLSYVVVSPVQSDVSCGISNEFQYTSAVDGGNATGAARVINGITLSPLVGAGPSATADNCTLNALAGSLANASAPDTKALPADGTLNEVVSDMTVNSGAPDDSQQEIVLDPASLAAGTTYDLRIYIANAGSPDREVNLSFVGDGQPPAETGFFNEDDARTSPGHFPDRSQVYYIDYRFTWDGASTPGVTITQKSGQAPFSFYALTNQPVVETATLPVAGASQPSSAQPGSAVGLTMASVSARSDHVGIASETFYGNESLNKHGRWIEVKKYGRAWQPTDAPSNWRPYSRGHFVHSGETGYTWASDASEADWGWATYHYGRWCRVPGIGTGWAWVPGTVWGGAWVSWRQARTPNDPYVGWAPLPPEAVCRVGVGISTWADREYDIGPDYYSFVHVRDFGADNYGEVILDSRQNVSYIERSVNITNISYASTSFGGRNGVNVNIASVNVYNGGPDFQSFNAQIRQQGGRPIQQVQIDRVGAANFAGGRGSELRGNTFVVFTPQVVQATPKVLPTIAATVPDDKIDRGWANVPDPKVANNLKSVIAAQTQGQTPLTTKAVLPPQIVRETSQPVASPTAASPAASSSPLASPTPSIAAGLASPAASSSPVTSSTPSIASSPTNLHPGNNLLSPSPASPAASSSALASATPSIAAGLASPSPASSSPVTSATPSLTASPANSHADANLPSPSPTSSAAASSPLPSATPGAGAKGLHPGGKIQPATAQSPAPVSATSPAVIPQPSPTVTAQHPGTKVPAETGRSPAQTVPSVTPASAAVPQATATAAGQHPGSKLAPTRDQSPAVLATASPAAAETPLSGKAQHPGATVAPSKAPSAAPSQTVAAAPSPAAHPQSSSVETKTQHPGDKSAPLHEASPAAAPATTATPKAARAGSRSPAATPPAEPHPSVGGEKSDVVGQQELKPVPKPSAASEQHSGVSREAGAPTPSAKTNAATSALRAGREQEHEAPPSPSPKQAVHEQEHGTPAKQPQPSSEAASAAQGKEAQLPQERARKTASPAPAAEPKAERIERNKQPRAEETPEPPPQRERQPSQQPRGAARPEQSTGAAEQKAEPPERKKQVPVETREQSPSPRLEQQRRPEQGQSQPAPAAQREQQLERRSQTQPTPERESQTTRQAQPQPDQQQQRRSQQQEQSARQQQQEQQQQVPQRQSPQRQGEPAAREPSEQRTPPPSSSQPRQQQGTRSATPTPTPNE